MTETTTLETRTYIHPSTTSAKAFLEAYTKLQDAITREQFSQVHLYSVRCYHLQNVLDTDVHLNMIKHNPVTANSLHLNTSRAQD